MQAPRARVKPAVKLTITQRAARIAKELALDAGLPAGACVAAALPLCELDATGSLVSQLARIETALFGRALGE